MCVESKSLDTLLSLKQDNKCNSLKNIISFDKFDDEKKVLA
jgi:hypothetical protein